MSTLWSQIHDLLLCAPPMPLSEIAKRLDVDPHSVSCALNVYAKRGHLVRVVRRDSPKLHWRLAVRDPRSHPIPGDCIGKGNDERCVERIERLPTGQLHKVYGPGGQFWHAASWRAWAADGAIVLKRGEE